MLPVMATITQVSKVAQLEMCRTVEVAELPSACRRRRVRNSDHRMQDHASKVFERI